MSASSVSVSRVALFIGVAIVSVPLARADAQTISTPQGLFPAATYRGASTTSGVTAFKGIRFAAAPTGARRFAPPFAPEPASGTLDATAFGSACPQVDSPFGAASASEDCLFLNVYVPGSPAATNRLPVMVFLHGGAFVSGASDQYDPSTLVTQGGAIVVTVNYRLGTLGYMAAPALTATDPRRTSGNYGFLDQQFALRWVQQNIAAFGGDRGRVSVFGDSAGGFSVCALLTAPTAAGLFQRAISESGPCSFPLPTRAASEASGTKFIEAVGCNGGTDADTVECLRQLDVQAVLESQTPASQLLSNPTALTQFFPNVDGAVIPQQPVLALALNQYNHVPVILGTNRDEGTLFVALAFDLLSNEPLRAAEYPTQIAIAADAVMQQVSAQLPGGDDSGLSTQLLAAEIQNQYPLSNYDTPGEALAAVITDGTFACPALITNELLSLSTPTYGYEFADRGAPMSILPPISFPYRAAHTAELQFLFDSPSELPSRLTSDEQTLATTLKQYWTQFASVGAPNALATSAPFWPVFSIAAPVVQSLAAPTPRPMLDFSAEHHCQFWQSILLQGTTLAVLSSAGGGAL
jgi:para-nitrobenzyl esterase